MRIRLESRHNKSESLRREKDMFKALLNLQSEKVRKRERREERPREVMRPIARRGRESSSAVDGRLAHESHLANVHDGIFGLGDRSNP